MSKRRDSPALFELVRTSGIQRPDPNARENPLREEPVAPTATPPPQTSSSAAVNEPDSFGRTIRLPMGYVFLAVAAMIVLLVLAYSVGFSRGRKEMPRRNDGAADLDQMQNERNLDGNDGSEDTSGPNEDLINPSEADIDLATIASQSTPNSAVRPARGEDTRESGLNYIIVEQFDAEEAELVADFLVGRGIDVMVLPTNNRPSNLRKVVIREGYQGWLSNDAAQTMFVRIKDLGRIWHANSQGSKNFDKLLAERFD